MGITGLLFLAGFTACMALALFRHPRFGLYAYLGVFYLHPPSRWWGVFLPDLRWSLLAALVTLVATWRLKADEERASWISFLGAKLLIAYTAWFWLQNLWALDRDENLEASILFTKYVMLFYLIYRLVDSTAEMRRFFVLHVLGCFYLGWLAYGATFEGRLEGVGGPGIDEANALAMHLGTAVMCGAMLVLVGPGLIRWVAVVAMPFILNAMVLAGSRGAFVASLAGSFVLLRYKPRTHRMAFYGLGVLALVLFGILANQMFWDRMGTITTGIEDESQMDTSAFSRIVVLEAQVEMAVSHPFGTGHRGTAILSPLYIDEKYLSAAPADGTIERRRASHNTFMTTWVEQGFPGAIMFVAMCAWAVSTVRRIRRMQAEGDAEVIAHTAALAGGLLLVFVAGMFVDYLKAEVQIWLFALLAAQFSIVLRGQAAVAESPMVAPADDAAAASVGRPRDALSLQRGSRRA